MSNQLINNEMINEKEVEDALEAVFNLSSALGITESELANILNKGIVLDSDIKYSDKTINTVKELINCPELDIGDIKLNLFEPDYRKKVDELKAGDFIAFAWSYFGGEPQEIWVSDITSVSDNGFLVHFMYGHKSMGEWIKKEDVLAIGNNTSGKSGIKGWSGKYDLIKPNHTLLIKELKLN